MTDAAGLESAARQGPVTLRFPCFDGLRAVAALAVLTTHVAFITGLNFESWLGMFTARLDVGVAVFFLISGFLLYRPFVAARLAGSPNPRAAAYFWRRALRIFPAYWLALTITIFVLDIPHEVPVAKDLFLYYGLLHLYSVDNVLGPIISSYTLVTEIAFYLFLPAYAFFVGAKPGSPGGHVRRDLLALTGLFTAGAIYRIVLSVADLPGDRDFQLQNILPGWIDVFATGMALAVVSAWLAHRSVGAPAGLDRPLAPAASWVLALLAFVLVSVFVGEPQPVEQYTIAEELAIHYLYLATGFFLLLPAIFGPQRHGAIRAFLRSPVVVWLGLVSYGLYLWNESLLDRFMEWTDRTAFNTSFTTTFVAVAAMTAGVAALSYYLLERPVLRLKRAVPDRRPPVPVATD